MLVHCTKEITLPFFKPTASMKPSTKKCKILWIRILCRVFGFNTNENNGFHAVRCTKGIIRVSTDLWELCMAFFASDVLAYITYTPAREFDCFVFAGLWPLLMAKCPLHKCLKPVMPMMKCYEV